MRVHFTEHRNTSHLDILIRTALKATYQNDKKFFARGWGNLECIEHFKDMRKKNSNESGRFRRNLDLFSKPSIKWNWESKNDTYVIKEGQFTSPIQEFLPEESKQVTFQLILPIKEEPSPIAFILPPTADHSFFLRRTRLSIPLVKEGIGSLLIESPLYGNRKPKEQIRSHLLHVSDLVLMGAALVSECNSLMNWLQMEGHGPFVFSVSYFIEIFDL
jgi:hypothetical protein